ncbi:alpha/beta fold hydrolase [Actinomadura parmotrematis]|uniref:Alpha/beta fold hydrolase n=1 Tax=Actinomadura parmotrematis TaxID=2864039 RepID=A0ABS7FNG4_9ACTN|nr:alpha/beta fold hydrolase [Actinomadura parmotrematis]MBW8481919.1 alpha/beta fold hydrolase [Actinomadura parmotrematis]
MLHYRDIHGYRRAYRVLGDGPPLLLVHGIGDSSATWEPVLARLAERHTVIAPDLLGHGDSAKPRADYAIGAYACGLRDLLTTLDADRVSVVGHSLGGGIAMQFAYQFPERVERLALVSSAGLGREVHPVFRLAAGPGAGLGMLLLTAPATRAAVRLSAPLLRALGGAGLGPDLDYVLGRYRRFADPTARRAFLRTIRAGVDLRGQAVTMLDRSYLARELPTLIVWGRRDGIIPARHALVAHAALPGSRLEVFEDAGHFPHHDDPDRFADVLGDFLKTEPARHDRRDWRDVLLHGRAAAPPEPSSGS